MTQESQGVSARIRESPGQGVKQGVKSPDLRATAQSRQHLRAKRWTQTWRLCTRTPNPLRFCAR